MADLRSTLTYEPRELRFGTSGRRGAVADLTQLEVYLNVVGELDFLLQLPKAQGGIQRGDCFYYGHDLRPSSTSFDERENGRGEICQAVARAISDVGLLPINLGGIPTPAVMHYASARRCGSIMVTGSHIPFNLNGYKLNTSAGELAKEHEAPIGESVGRVRSRLYGMDATGSAFGPNGMFRSGHVAVPAADPHAREAYIRRYTEFFAGKPLAGKRILAYQHSAVGRDLLVEVLAALGATVIPAGRSEQFVAIDTEAIDAAQLDAVQRLADENDARSLWAIVSTDGDSDRPLILGVAEGGVRFFPGDLVGMVVAQFLRADAVVVPISCNDAIDRGALAQMLEPKTKIGSPHVIAGMARALAKGRKTVCGWEANGGFLLGSGITRDGQQLTALPTRDAILPILAVLCAAAERGMTLSEMFAELPPRFSRAALLRNFPREDGRALVGLLTANTRDEEASIARKLEGFFKPKDGFSGIGRIDYTDGVRILFANGEVAHFRPSGNADEFRMYAVADTQERADRMIELGLAQPDGIILRIAREMLGS